jgi:uncharacterized short protein YbdD (DUF466 family)
MSSDPATPAKTRDLGWSKRTWLWLRQVTGDAAYENYLRHAITHPDDAKTLSRREFYIDSLRRRYSTVSRCC